METKDQTVLTDTQKEGIYKTACAKMRGVKNADMQREAIALFRTIPGYRDADGQIAVCEQRIRALEEKEEAERSEAERRKKKRKTALAIALPVLAVLLAIAVLLPLVILPGIRYAKAKVSNVNGVILLPDNWSNNTFELNNTNNIESEYVGH